MKAESEAKKKAEELTLSQAELEALKKKADQDRSVFIQSKPKLKDSPEKSSSDPDLNAYDNAPKSLFQKFKDFFSQKWNE